MRIVLSFVVVHYICHKIELIHIIIMSSSETKSYKFNCNKQFKYVLMNQWMHHRSNNIRIIFLVCNVYQPQVVVQMGYISSKQKNLGGNYLNQVPFEIHHTHTTLWLIRSLIVDRLWQSIHFLNSLLNKNIDRQCNVNVVGKKLYILGAKYEKDLVPIVLFLLVKWYDPIFLVSCK